MSKKRNIIKHYIFTNPCIAEMSPYPVTNEYPGKKTHEGYRLEDGLFLAQRGLESPNESNVLQEDFLFDSYNDALMLARAVGVRVIKLCDEDGDFVTYLVRYHIVDGVLETLDEEDEE